MTDYAIIDNDRQIIINVVNDSLPILTFCPNQSNVPLSDLPEGVFVKYENVNGQWREADWMVVTNPQAKRAVAQMGLRATVEAIVAQADADTQALWYESDTVHRDHPSIIALGPMAGLTPKQLDDLFRLAKTL